METQINAIAFIIVILYSVCSAVYKRYKYFQLFKKVKNASTDSNLVNELSNIIKNLDRKNIKFSAGRGFGSYKFQDIEISNFGYSNPWGSGIYRIKIEKSHKILDVKKEYSYMLNLLLDEKTYKHLFKHNPLDYCYFQC